MRMGEKKLLLPHSKLNHAGLMLMLPPQLRISIVSKHASKQASYQISKKPHDSLPTLLTCIMYCTMHVRLKILFLKSIRR